MNNQAAQTANVRRYMDLKELQVADRDQDGGPLNASLQETYAIDPDAEADKSKFMRGSYIKDAFGNPYGYYFNPDATRRDAGKEPIKALYGKSIYDLWSTLGGKGGDQHVVSRWAHSWTEEL